LTGGTWSGPGVIDPVQGIFDPTIMGAGSYDVWYQVNDPCIAPGFATIEVQSVPNYTFSVPTAICLDATPVVLSQTNTLGGTFSGNGIVDATLGTFDPTVASVGIHSLTWDVPGVCPTSYTQDIEVWVLPVVDAGVDVNVCDGDLQALLAAGATNYTWTPAVLLDNPNAANPNATISSTSVFTVVGTDGNGCQSTDDVTLTWIPITTPIIAPAGPLCEAGAPVNLSVDVAGGVWSGPGITDSSTGAFSPVTSGDGNITVSYDLGWQCSVVAQLSIEVQAVPTTTLSAPLHVCIDGPVVQLSQLNASVGTYVGNGIQNAVNGNFNPQVAGVGAQVVTWNIPGVCPISPTATINVHDLPAVNAGADDDACYGLPYALGASGASTYTWTPTSFLSNAAIASPNATITVDQTFTVVGTDSYGCVNSDQVSLHVLPLPQVSTQSVGMICPGTPTPLSAVGSTGTFSWLPNSAISKANTANPTASPMTTTTYTVTLTDGCGLTAQDQATVPVETIYTVLAGADDAFCEGTSTVIQATIQPFDAQFSWSTVNGQLNGAGDQVQLLVDVEGDYALHAITPLGCTYDDVVHVDEVPLPVISMADSVDLCPASTVTLQAGNNWDQVQWSHGPTTGQTTVSQAGDYYVTATNSGCSSSDSITVIQVVLPYLELGPDVEICQGTLATLNAGVIGSWSTGANAASITVSQEGTYEIEVRVGFCSETDSVHVTVEPLPVLNLDADVVGCIDEIIYLYAGHPYNESYIWSTGETIPMIEVMEPGVYWVTASNECGSVSDQSDVYFEDCSYAVYMPSSFTPDADGINDEWKMTTYNMKEVEVVIVNRWGQEVFKSNDPQAVWTGSVQGGTYYSPDGAYALRFKGTTIKDEVVERTATILLIR
ncbi:MAG: gliding motility-associated C-terminal domain-containing protein, partial [Flavobacteriales bacterium]